MSVRRYGVFFVACISGSIVQSYYIESFNSGQTLSLNVLASCSSEIELGIRQEGWACLLILFSSTLGVLKFPLDRRRCLIRVGASSC